MNVISILTLVFLFSISVFSMGAPPKEAKKATNSDREQASIINVIKKKQEEKQVQKAVVETTASETVVVTKAPVAELSEDEAYQLEENREKYEKFKRKNFVKAEEYLEKIPADYRTTEEKETLEKLKIFDTVLEEQKQWESQFGKQDDLDLYTRNQVNRLYKSAQVAIIDGELELASDYLSQATFLDPKDQRIKRLGELVLGEKPQRVNVEAKYHELSIKNIYTGNFKEAAAELEILAKFSPDDPVIYERMGTAYYLDWEIEKAVQSWKSALYYNSPNEELLNRWIENAEKYKEEQHKEIISLLSNKKKDVENQVDDDDYIITVLFTSSDQAKATSYAQEAGGYLKAGEKIEVRENFETGDFQVVKLVPKPPEA